MMFGNRNCKQLAGHIGRVGALAVALGVSGAVATTPGAAWADETPSSAASGSAAEESNQTSPSSDDDPAPVPARSRSTEPSAGATTTSSLNDPTDESGGVDMPSGSGTTAQTVTIGDGEVTVSYPSPQYISDGQLVFRSWSDGGAQNHTIITPGTTPATQ